MRHERNEYIPLSLEHSENKENIYEMLQVPNIYCDLNKFCSKNEELDCI